MEIIKLLILVMVILVTNFLFKSKIFIKLYWIKHQTFISKKVPLSGGFIILIYFFINHLDQNLILSVYSYFF